MHLFSNDMEVNGMSVAWNLQLMKLNALRGIQCLTIWLLWEVPNGFNYHKNGSEYLFY